MHAVGATPVTMGRRDLDYDEVLRYIGQFGTFQVYLALDSGVKTFKTKNLVRNGSSSGFGSCPQEVD